ncbi:hypothetical protein LAG90_05230 [Marinilongibacter aquaticus]|uniref:STM3941 family protein n=1 Tax=Marinilongibacter aquaticus TaxID=2975157 RepID=UPI0021BDB210|nr:STM3941 family protein [Marinilongibacter aquaticus]UBM60047.1 hypothetical protein LAG90_05230 [Marinilongibacter aquaticus]
MNNRVEIELSKRKLIVLLIGAIIFVTFGSFGSKFPESFVSTLFRNPELIRVSSIAAVCFFGTVSIFLVKKIFDKKPGLVVDEQGITDNTSATSVGPIEWRDIIRIEKKEVALTRFLLLHINNPEKYIQRINNIFSRRTAQMNFKMYGTPISIVSNSLKIDFEELEELIDGKLKRMNNG